jgi:hypothetical protein
MAVCAMPAQINRCIFHQQVVLTTHAAQPLRGHTVYSTSKLGALGCTFWALLLYLTFACQRPYKGLGTHKLTMESPATPSLSLSASEESFVLSCALSIHCRPIGAHTSQSGPGQPVNTSSIAHRFTDICCLHHKSFALLRPCSFTLDLWLFGLLLPVALQTSTKHICLVTKPGVCLYSSTDIDQCSLVGPMAMSPLLQLKLADMVRSFSALCCHCGLWSASLQPYSAVNG